jgi:hypothetical protein
MRAGIMRYGAVLVMGVLLSTTTVSAQSEETSLVITLDNPVHFSGQDDQDVMLPAGSYLLEEGGSTKGTNASVGLPGGFKKWAKEFTIHMPWVSWLGGEALYGVKLLACGPWGVPY